MSGRNEDPNGDKLDSDASSLTLLRARTIDTVSRAGNSDDAGVSISLVGTLESESRRASSRYLWFPPLSSV